MSTTVIHKRRTKHAHLDYVNIGRGSKWGNPFLIGKNGTRAEVIELYRKWLAGDPAALELAAAVEGQRRRPPTADEIRVELRGKVLVCWCKPAACHGDVLAEIADETNTRR